MWRNKKRDTPQAADLEPKSVQTNRPPMPTLASREETTKMNKDAVPAAGGGGIADRATARLGLSLDVKGEISGSEDLYIDGKVEGQSSLTSN